MTNVTGIKTGGRKAGTPNKTTKEIRDMAMGYADGAIELIIHLMNNSQSDSVRLSAARELLDRCCGRATDHAAIRSYERNGT